MKKVQIKIPDINEKEVISLFDTEVEINTLITLEQYSQIAEDIRNVVFLNDKVVDKYMSFKIRYVQDVLNFCTNIDTEKLKAEDINILFNMGELHTLITKIKNFYDIFKILEKEYEKFILEDCFGALGKTMPSSEDMEKSMKMLSETIDKIPQDKLELIGKSIVWNNIPALGNQISPATHISQDEKDNVVELKDEN